jgi:hypothetical protein
MFLIVHVISSHALVLDCSALERRETGQPVHIKTGRKPLVNTVQLQELVNITNDRDFSLDSFKRYVAYVSAIILFVPYAHFTKRFSDAYLTIFVPVCGVAPMSSVQRYSNSAQKRIPRPRR